MEFISACLRCSLIEVGASPLRLRGTEQTEPGLKMGEKSGALNS